MSRKIVYSPRYNVDIGAHVFPTNKYDLIKANLIKTRAFKQEDFIEPQPASDEVVALAHTKEYVEKIKYGRLMPAEELRLELPWSEGLALASFICVDGTIKASEIALKEMVGIHLGGGFHHAFADHGEGFCVFNDIAVAVRYLQKQRGVSKFAVIDCDLHQGNGTAAIFKGDKSVFTFSMHQENNYPYPKGHSSWDIGLDDSAGDDIYLEHLDAAVSKIIKEENPEFVVYVAGSDPYKYDKLGALKLTIEGLKKRDEIVIGSCTKEDIPIAIVLAGGYAQDIKDTVAIHTNTVLVACRYSSGV